MIPRYNAYIFLWCFSHPWMAKITWRNQATNHKRPFMIHRYFSFIQPWLWLAEWMSWAGLFLTTEIKGFKLNLPYMEIHPLGTRVANQINLFVWSKESRVSRGGFNDSLWEKRSTKAQRGRSDGGTTLNGRETWSHHWLQHVTDLSWMHTLPWMDRVGWGKLHLWCVGDYTLEPLQNALYVYP